MKWGRVIVWSDGSTGFYGSLSARGGSLSGDGGFAEVSGKGYLDFRGSADLRASAGATGTLLLDPDDIIIVPGNVYTGTAPSLLAWLPTNPGGVGDGIWDFPEDPGPQTIGANDVTTILGLVSLDLRATNSVVVGAPLNYASPNSLTLTAGNLVGVAAPITNAGPGGIAMIAPTVNIGIGAPVMLSVGVGLAITTDNLTVGAPVISPSGISIAPFTAGQGFALNAAGPPAAGDLSTATLNSLFTAGSGILIGDASTGAITVNAGNHGTQDWGVLSLRGTSVTFTGQLTLPSNAQMLFDQVAGAITGSGGMDLVIPGWGMLAFNNVGGAANLMTNVNRLGTTTVSGLTLDNSANSLSVENPVVSNNNPISINALGLTNSAGCTINAGTSTFTLRADGVGLLATVTADGGISIAPLSAGTSVGLNGGIGTLGLTTAELGFLSSNGGTVTIGSAGAGAVTVAAGDLSAQNWTGLTLNGASVAFTGQLTLPNNALMTFGQVAGTVAGSGGTDLVIGGTTGTLAFTNVGGSANLITDIDQLAASAVAGLTLDNQNNSLTLTGALDSSNQPISISVGTGTFTNNAGATINAGTSTFTLSADDASISDWIAANGGITIYTATGTQDIDLSSGGSGTLSLDANEFGFLSSTTGVTIGRTTNASNIDIGQSAALTLGYNLTIIGDDYDQGTNTVTANAVTLQVDTIDVGTTLTASVGGITIGPRTANRTIALGDNATGSLDISEAELARLSAVTGLTFGNVGAVAAGAIDVQDNDGSPSLASTLPITLLTNGAITVDSTVSVPSATLTSLGSTVDINAQMTIGNAGNLGITASGSVTIAGKIDFATGTGGDLTITAGGKVDVNAAIDPPAQVLIDSNGNITINAAVTADDLIQLRAGRTTGIGGVEITASGSLVTDNVANTSDIWLEASFAGGTSGDIIFRGNVTTEDLLTAVAHVGAISRTAGSLSATQASLYGATGVAHSSIDVTTLAAGTGGAAGQNINLTDTAGGLDIGTVGTTVGVNAGLGDVTLQSGAAVTQSQALVAAGLELLGSGPYTLTNASNDVTTLAGNTGAVSFRDTSGFAIGTVNTVGLTSSGIASAE